MEQSPAGGALTPLSTLQSMGGKSGPTTPGKAASDQWRRSAGGKPGMTEVTVVSVPRDLPDWHLFRASARNCVCLPPCHTEPPGAAHPPLKFLRQPYLHRVLKLHTPSPPKFFTIPHAHHAHFSTPRRFHLLPLSPVSSSYIFVQSSSTLLHIHLLTSCTLGSLSPISRTVWIWPDRLNFLSRASSP